MSLRRRLLLGVLPVALLAGCAQAPPASVAPSAAASASAAGTVVITDHWKRAVTVPVNPKRVVVIEWEGLVSKSMQMLGVGDRIVGIDTPSKKEPFRNIVVPALGKADQLGTAFSGINTEALAALRPDVVFLEAWVASDKNRTLHEELVAKIERLKIPVIVMLSPSNFPEPRLDTAWQMIGFVGQVFGQTAKTDAIVARIQRGIALVTDRLKDVPESERPEVAIFASARYLLGEKSIQSAMVTGLLKAKNVVGQGTFVETSEEKLLALNPAHLVVIGHEGYIGREAILGGKQLGIDWGKVRTLRALQDQRLAVLGYDEWRATIETPVALLKMAAMLYPKRFADVDVAKEELAFYQDVFGLTPEQAQAAVKGQQYEGTLVK